MRQNKRSFRSIQITITLLVTVIRIFDKPTATPMPSVPEKEQSTESTLAPTRAAIAMASPTPAESSGQVEVLEGEYLQDFSKTAAEWDSQPFENDAVRAAYQISGGVFTWDVTARQDSTLMKTPDPRQALPAGDFLLSTSIQIKSQDDPIAAGLMFRFQDFENFYFAKLSRQGEVSVYVLQKNQWSNLVKAVKSAHFSPDKANLLTVVQRGNQYEVQVNDYPAASFRDDRFRGGDFGLIVELNSGMKGTFIFDDVRVMRAGGSAAVAAEDETPAALPTMTGMGASRFTYEGEANGVQYEIDYPAVFVHTTTGGWQNFCLDAPEQLCVSVQREEGNWDTPKAMADEIMTAFASSVGDYQELGRQSASTAEGMSAYQVEYTYTWHDTKLKGVSLFVLVQHVGFEIAGYGEPPMMEVYYQAVIKGMMESFRLNYN